jgi:hypothetical protein
MVELAGRASSLAQSRRVDRRPVTEHRTGRTCAIGDIVLRARAIHLLRAQVVAVVGKRVGRATGIGDTHNAVLDIVGQAGDAAADGDGRTVAVEVVAVCLAARAGEFVVGIVGVGRRHACLRLAQAVVVVVVSIRQRIARAVAVVADFARQLVARVVAEGGHGSVGVGAGEDAAGGIVRVAVLCQGHTSARLVQNPGRAVGGIVSVTGHAAVAVGRARQPVGDVVAVRPTARYPAVLPREIVLDFLCAYLVDTDPKHFVLMNSNGGDEPELAGLSIRDKRTKARLKSERVLTAFDVFLASLQARASSFLP